MSELTEFLVVTLTAHYYIHSFIDNYLQNLILQVKELGLIRTINNYYIILSADNNESLYNEVAVLI